MKQLSFSHRVSPDVSAGQCLKFCDDTPSAAMLPNLFQQDAAPAHRSRHTVAYLRSNVPEFFEPETGHQTARILIRLLMQFRGITADGVSSQNFTHWPAETCAYRLLGSAKPGHIESSDRSAAKKTDDAWSSRQRVPTRSFVWTNSVGKLQLFHFMFV